MSSAKAPRQPCIAFEKLDGSNCRVKYTNKKGFHLFGSRTQMFDKGHPFLGAAVDIFYRDFENPLVDLIETEFPNEREVIAFLEFFGDKSFAGRHDPEDTTKKLVCFDIMIGHKNRVFLMPQDFVKLTKKHRVTAPQVVYTGNLTDQFITDVRAGHYPLNEGVVCKGTEKTGAHRGHVWMAKIKTQAYLDKLFNSYGEDGVKKYGE